MRRSPSADSMVPIAKDLFVELGEDDFPVDEGMTETSEPPPLSTSTYPPSLEVHKLGATSRKVSPPAASTEPQNEDDENPTTDYEHYFGSMFSCFVLHGDPQECGVNGCMSDKVCGVGHDQRAKDDGTPDVEREDDDSMMMRADGKNVCYSEV